MHIKRFYETFYPYGDAQVKSVRDYIKLNFKWFDNNTEAGDGACEVLEIGNSPEGAYSEGLNYEEYEFNRVCKCCKLQSMFELHTFSNSDGWRKVGLYDTKREAEETGQLHRVQEPIDTYKVTFAANKGTFDSVIIDKGEFFGKVQTLTIYPLNNQYFPQPTAKEITLFENLLSSGIYAKTSRFDL